jgi:predicted enzyme related to lactoylglutathione lyase
VDKRIAVWFEIPVSDMDRAARFYSEVMGFEVRVEEMFGSKMGFFPMEDVPMSGALTQTDDFRPGADGVLIYLNGGEDLSSMLARVEPAGGRVMTPKTKISDDIGYFALFTDTEGNRLGLHSRT